MKQSRLGSMMETIISTASGFALSLLLQWLVLPHLLGVPMPLAVNLAFAAVMTVASLARGYVIRRIMERYRISFRLTPFMQAVIAECFRQRDQEGWSTEHDDNDHQPGDLACAGSCYARFAGNPQGSEPPAAWPWSDHWWKPAGFRRDLVKGCALIIAEGDKFDRSKRARSK